MLGQFSSKATHLTILLNLKKEKTRQKCLDKNKILPRIVVANASILYKCLK